MSTHPSDAPHCNTTTDERSVERFFVEDAVRETSPHAPASLFLWIAVAFLLLLILAGYLV